MQNPRIPEWLRPTGPLEVALSNPVLQHRETSPMPRRPLQGGALSTLGQPVPGLRHLPSTDMLPEINSYSQVTNYGNCYKLKIAYTISIDFLSRNVILVTWSSFIFRYWIIHLLMHFN